MGPAVQDREVYPRLRPEACDVACPQASVGVAGRMGGADYGRHSKAGEGDTGEEGVREGGR